MIEKRSFYTFMTSAVISGVLIICTSGQNVRSEKIKANVTPTAESLESTSFIIKEYNGKLGIFRGDSKSPYKVLDCSFSLLSDYDKQQLKEGIEVETESELNSLIEDYTS